MPYSVFLDFDGTLLPSGADKISDRTLKVLTEVQQKRHKVFLNTGRPPSWLCTEAYRGFRFDGYLCGSCYVNIGGKILMADRMAPDEIQPIVSYFYGRDIIVLLEGEKSVRAVYDKDGKTGFLPLTDMEEIFRVCKSEPITKMNVLKLLEGEDLEFVKKFGDPILRDDADCTEIVPHGHSKAAVMQLVIDHLGLEPKTVIAMGDTNNDIPMLDAAAISIAMGNASDEVKKHAKFVTLSAENDGVAVALEKFLL